MPKVMIIDDNEDNSRLLGMIFEDEGYSVSIFDRARPAIESLNNESFDIVLMDISMPEMDGIEATKIIRSTPHIQHIPIIAVTAHAIQSEIDKIIKSGVNDLVTKPIDEELIISKVQKLVQ